MNLLETYRERYETSRPMHPVLLEAAADSRLQTEELIRLALSYVEKKRTHEQPNASFPLLILQQRVTPEILQKAYDLLQGKEPAARQLGTCILREFPGLNHAPYPHSIEAIGKLERMLAHETDLDVLVYGLSAIGWQRHPAGLTVLLRHRHHEQDCVRYIVANNLIGCCPNNAPLPTTALNALLDFTRDSDPDIRWSVFWDIAEFSTIFHGWITQLQIAAQMGTTDPDNKVRAVARAYA